MLSEKHEKKRIKHTNCKKKVKEKLDYKEKWDEYMYKYEYNDEKSEISGEKRP